MAQWLADVWLEYRIGAAYHLWLFADEPKRRQHLLRMNRLIGERSPRQIDRMERAMGLASDGRGK